MRITATIDLDERQERFVYALAYGLPPTRAATAAGYSIGHAKALLCKPQIVAALLAVRDNADTVLSIIDPPERGVA